MTLTSAACPGFVEFVERGQTTGDEVTVLAERLLAPVRDADVDALLLGCTHYPFLARTISDVMGHEVTLVSSADETAFAVRDRLGELGLCARPRSRVGRHRFVSSGDVDMFRELGSQLLGPELDHTERWDPPPRNPVGPARWHDRPSDPNPGDHHVTPRRPRRRRTPPDLVRTRLHRDGRRLGARHVRQHPGAVHGEHRRGRARGGCAAAARGG